MNEFTWLLTFYIPWWYCWDQEPEVRKRRSLRVAACVLLLLFGRPFL